MRRRDFINIAAVSFAGMGAVAVVVPLIDQMNPSADVLALAWTEVDLSAIAAELAELYEPLVEDAGMTLVNEIDAPLPIAGNRELIGQAITNLIDNAIKYGCKPDGKITISAERAGGKWLRLAVSDQGSGVPDEDKERVKGRFVRLDESRTKPGSGLGLSLVSAIMGLHGGDLTLEDAAPGLRVVLSFPVSKS